MIIFILHAYMLLFIYFFFFFKSLVALNRFCNNDSARNEYALII